VPGRAGQGDKVDLGIGEQVHCEVLLAVACGHAPDCIFQVVEIFECVEHRGFAADLGHTCIQAGLAGSFEVHKLVDHQAGHQRAR
jgi:hypothetical protein